ncbi:MAG TPA: hypothetical protein PLR94_15575, partial [Accumulibacter sp.]|nr:hypothetical protein [Accumulibacter sp.]
MRLRFVLLVTLSLLFGLLAQPLDGARLPPGLLSALPGLTLSSHRYRCKTSSPTARDTATGKPIKLHAESSEPDELEGNPMLDMPSDWTALLVLVFVLGIKHGFDADH